MKSTNKFGAVIRLLLASLVLAMALGLLFKAALPVGAGRVIGSSERSGVSQPQDEEKSLDINRYPKEPVELVDLKIRGNSVKDKIKSRVKDNANQSRVDNVKFKEKNDWFKNIKIRLRNISGRPIYGLDVSLLFKAPNLEVGFRASVKESQTRQLKNRPLQPGEEIDLGVEDGSLGQMLAYMIQNGVDANQSTLRLAVEGASFGDDFGWRKGALMRRNPNDPKKWDVVDEPEPPPQPSEASRLFQPAGFKVTGVKSILDPLQQDLYRCQDHQAGIQTWACNGDPNDPCDTVKEIGDGRGYFSNTWVFEMCIYHPGPTAEYCGNITLHNFLEFDVTCAAPSPTPTPLSCLPDGYVYSGDTPCCSGSSNAGLCGPALEPTPPTCWPNGYYYFGITPCCSGYYGPDNICATNPGTSGCTPNGQLHLFSPCCSGYYGSDGVCAAGPPPTTCTPNGMLHLFGPCCSGYSGPDGVCAANPGPPPPTCTANGFYSFTIPCCSGYSGPDGICAAPPTGGGGPGGGGGDWCYYSDCGCWDDWDCGSYCDWDGYCAWDWWLDPIVIDLKGDGFAMTDAANGVTFDFFGRGVSRKLSWTVAGADDAWLVLDRNRNGNIDSAIEMFSNVAPQPSPPAGVLRIGFAALAEFDKAGNGGNGDGVIDKNDQVIQYLRLWQDVNHNGISESSELHSLPELGLESMLLDYKESRRTDRWGNTFRYRAKVYGTNHKDMGRWAYDVVLFTSQPAPGRATTHLQDSGQLPLWRVGVLRPLRSEWLAQIGNLPADKSFLREISSSASLLWGRAPIAP